MQKQAVDIDQAEGPDRKDLLGEGESVTDNPNATSSGPSLASNLGASKSSIVMIVVGVVVIGAVFAYFQLKPKKVAPKQQLMPFEVNKPQTAGEVVMPSLSASYSPGSAGSLLSAEPTIAAKPETTAPDYHAAAIPSKAAAPEPKPFPVPSVLESHEDPPVQSLSSKLAAKNEAKQQAAQAQAKSGPIMLINGGGSGGETGGVSKSGLDHASASGSFSPALTSASNVKVTKVGDMSLTIVQGHIIDAVLETPVNTNFTSPVRALISKEVYSEKGSNILIPKGSRLIGTMASGYSPGTTRVMINWTRIIMPSGFDINITAAPAVGNLGSIGIEGFVDRQFLETVGSAALLSIINIGTANAIQREFNIQPSQTTQNIGSASGSANITTTTTNTPTSEAAQTELQNLSSTTQSWFKQNFNPTPYIVLDQGTRVKVFVNQDIHFPKNLGTSGVIK